VELKGEFRKLFIQLVRSHSKLSSAEYHRNPSYNNEHFSHIAEQELLDYLTINDEKLLNEICSKKEPIK